MPREMLSDLRVRTAKPATATYEISDATLPALRLRVQPGGAKKWIVRTKVEGKSIGVTLEKAHPELGLSAARDEARRIISEAQAGRDPRPKVRKAEAKAKAAVEAVEGEQYRFGKVAADFIAIYAKRRNRGWKETQRTLTRADLAAWQERDLRTITRADVIAVLDAMVARDAATQANRLLAQLRRFMGWTIERGLLESSPCEGLKPPTPEVERDRVLTDAELLAVWRAAEAEKGPFGWGVRLLALTGVRLSEAFDATWNEFELDGPEPSWVIPVERSKNGIAHHVPLAPAVVGLLRNLPRVTGSPYLFTTSGRTPFGGFGKATDRLRAAAAVIYADTVQEPLQPWRLHDLRRTFASGCARLGVSVQVVEKCLNHASGTFRGIVKVYQRHDFAIERRDAMNRWAAHVSGLVNPAANDVVVRLQLRGRPM